MDTIAFKKHRLKKIINLLPEKSGRIVDDALKFAKEKHLYQKKFDSDPFVDHILNVTLCLVDLFSSIDPIQMSAALLHDVMEDTNTKENEIKERFGGEVSYILSQITNPAIQKAKESEKYILKHHFFERHILGGSLNLRQIAISDKLDNLNRACRMAENGTILPKFHRWIKEAKEMIVITDDMPPHVSHIFIQAIDRLNNLLKSNISQKAKIILIGGMPASGKSTTAIGLAKALGTGLVISTDEIRDVMQIYDSRPIIQGKTHDRWVLFGPNNKVNLRRGLFEHAEAIKPGVEAVIAKNLRLGEIVVIEGVHLIPSLYKFLGDQVRHFILKPKDRSFHLKLLAEKAKRRQLTKVYHKTKINQLHSLQQEIIKDALENNTPIIPSGYDAVTQILRLING